MIRLHNTLTRKKAVLRPLVEGKIGIYTCGPTLHDFAHVGLIRRLLVVDLLKRVLQHDGYQVRHIVNLTDIDDKTIAESAKRGVRLDELCGLYRREFFEDMTRLRMFPADHYPSATEHVSDMIDVTKRLVDRGLAYVLHRSVYFDISKFPAYGRLSRVDRRKIRSGVTVDLDYYEKDDAHDFTLMRRSDLSELRRRITYKTEWGNVRPGWHIECATMATRYLGEQFDIHTSGEDLIFPHNENENAICEALHGKPMARYWLHAGLILYKGKKMSRSAGTALTLRDLLARGYTGSQVRYYLLSVHYSMHLDFSFEGLDAACRELERLNALIQSLRFVRFEGQPDPLLDHAVEETEKGFFEALRDDLNVPKARATLFALARKLNARLASGSLSRADAELALDFLYRADRVLAVADFGEERGLDPEVERLLLERDQARAARDFARADRIREELATLGVIVEDTPSGQRVRRKKDS